MKLSLLFAALLLSGCATASLAPPPATGIVHAVVGDGGYYFNAGDKAVIVGEGVPAAWFSLKPKGWYLSSQQEKLAANICAAERNPGVWPSQEINP